MSTTNPIVYTEAIMESIYGRSSTYASAMMNQSSQYLAGLAALATYELPELGDVDVPIDFPVPTGAPTAPDIYALPTEPDEPSVEISEAPAAPSVTYPTAPVLSIITIPDAPEYSMPTFTALDPVDTSVAPTVYIDSGNTPYSSTLMDAVKEKLRKNITEGGTGLSADVEDAIFDRDSERAELLLADEIDRFSDEWSKRGFDLPDGVFAENLQALHREHTNKRLDTSRDIAIKQAELEQNNLKYSIEQAVSLEQVLSNIANEWAQRTFLTSKAIMDASIEIFRGQITKYNAAVQAYQAKVEVYKSMIQGELTKAELYKSQIAGLQLVAQVDQSRVESYKAQLQGCETRINAYKAEVDAYRGKIEGQKAIIDIYGGRIEAYAQKVNAQTHAYNAQVEYFKANTQAWATTQEIAFKNREATVHALISKANIQVMRWSAMLKHYENLKATAIEAQRGAAQIAGSIASAALAGISAHAQISGSGSLSTAWTVDTNYNYDY